MRHKIRGKIWNVRRVPNLGKFLDLGQTRGSCDPPDKKNKEIKILSSLRGQELIEVLIHEGLHAAFWDIDETVIEQVADDLARLLAKEITGLNK
jgi:hypothetical protein